jgi:hypothetical protein
MTRFSRCIRGLAIAAATLVGLSSTAVLAQATRTWVSGVGDDANPCSRTAPCKTFAGAISKTAAGGEINCLDPGGFGAVTITKAITINCTYTEGGIAATGTNGITVNAGANDVVVLRGLDIQGFGTGLNGIRFLNGAALHVEDCLIRGFSAANGQGISFQPSGLAELFVTDTLVVSNGTTANGGGILVRPTGFGAARVALRNVRVQNNLFAGFLVDTTGNTGPGTTVSVEDSQFDGSTNGVTLNVPAGNSAASIFMVNSTVAQNSGTGISASGSAATMRIGNTSIFNNNIGVSAAGSATILSYQDNRLNGNLTDGSFTGTSGKQ